MVGPGSLCPQLAIVVQYIWAYGVKVSSDDVRHILIPGQQAVLLHAAFCQGIIQPIGPSIRYNSDVSCATGHYSSVWRLKLTL